MVEDRPQRAADGGDPPPPAELSILVVSYNTRDLTVACLESVRRETRRTRYEVIVADNASADGSADEIARRFPEFVLIRLERNVGFGRGCNAAAAAATGSHVLLLNPDTVVLDGAIDRLHEFALAQGGDTICGGRTLASDGTLDPTSCWGRMTPWSLACWSAGLSAAFAGSRLLNPETYPGWARDSVREVDIVTGCLLHLPRPLWDRLAGFDPRFFMYFEEADLCLRARRAGARCVFFPGATIVHHGGQSDRVAADKLVRLLTAQVQYVDKHWGPLFGGLGRGTLAGGVALRAAAARLGASSGRLRANGASWREAWRRRSEWLTPPH